MPPVIIFCCTGLEHLIYCVWAVRSLKAFGYKAIEVVVNKEDEKNFIESHLDVPYEAVNVDIGNYGMWAFRVFALKKYKIKHADRDVVVCDVDILWKKDPLKLFNRFKGKAWVHKITSLNPADLSMEIKDVPASRIGLQTMINYKNRIGLKAYPNFHLNCGLFMLPKETFHKILDDWDKKLRLLPPKEMIMTEALLSLAFNDMGLSPTSDRQNIKHIGIRHDPVDVPIVSFVAADVPEGMSSGYETAQHYFSDQRKYLHRDAVRMGLDSDNLVRIAKREVFLKRLKRLPKVPGKIIRKLRAVSKIDTKPTIYYVVDNKGWVQHRRFQHLKRYIYTYRLRLLTTQRLKILWKLGFLRKDYICFSTWRIVHGLIKKDPRIFSDSDFGRFMAAVTSHSNIGGGLDPLNPIPGRGPKEAFDLAVGLLKKFKVVSVNSMILYELLSSSLPNLLYCPNGVDTDFFRPKRTKEYDPDCIRIGWVGKIRGPKNFDTIERGLRELESLGRIKAEFVKVPKDFKRISLSFRKMRRFYENIDFYLCASWNEGTPNPALEAGACAVPVVTTRVGNMRELIADNKNGFFIEPTAESIVSRFKEIGGMTKERYDEISRSIRKSIIRDWSWRERVNNFISCFDKLVAER